GALPRRPVPWCVSERLERRRGGPGQGRQVALGRLGVADDDRPPVQRARDEVEGQGVVEAGTQFAAPLGRGDVAEGDPVLALPERRLQGVGDLGVAGRLGLEVEEDLRGDRLADHDDTTARIDKAAAGRDTTGAPVWYVDVRSNQVVVRAARPSAARSLLSAAGIGASLARVEKSAEQPRPLYDLRGGEAYYINNSGRCSIGFPVTKGTQQGYATAGHCGRAGAATSGHNRVAQGTFQGSVFPGRDMAWVATNSSWTATPYVKGAGGQNVQVTGSTQAPVGSSVCRSGSTTGWHCGVIQQLNTSVTYPEGTITGVTRTSVCAEPGDSGGSYISGSQAQGVTSGGSGNCISGGTTYFQPLNPLLQNYGLTLKTTGGNEEPPPGGEEPGGTWSAGTVYQAGDTVTHGGATYRCLQGHQAQPGWEPPNVPALWQRV